jgi:hypothetical protein
MRSLNSFFKRISDRKIILQTKKKKHNTNERNKVMNNNNNKCLFTHCFHAVLFDLYH